MTHNSDVARTGRPKYEDETGGRTETAMVWLTPGERDAFKQAASEDGETLSDWLRGLARRRARRLGIEMPQSLSSD